VSDRFSARGREKSKMDLSETARLNGRKGGDLLFGATRRGKLQQDREHPIKGIWETMRKVSSPRERIPVINVYNQKKRGNVKKKGGTKEEVVEEKPRLVRKGYKPTPTDALKKGARIRGKGSNQWLGKKGRNAGGRKRLKGGIS